MLALRRICQVTEIAGYRQRGQDLDRLSRVLAARLIFAIGYRYCRARIRPRCFEVHSPSFFGTSFLARAIAATAFFLPVLLPDSALAQTPRTVRVVIPFPVSGAADIMIRVLAEEIGRAQGATMVIENRPGAGAVIGTEVVARAAPDGNTVLVNSNSFVIGPSLRKLTYDPLTSFDPICRLAGTPMFIVVGSASPYRTLADLLGAARSRPGELTLASLGPATAQHIAFELLKRMAQVEMTFVPFAGNVPAINHLMGGHVSSSLANFSDVIEHVRAGKLRALATTARARNDRLPEVPTIAELGFSEYAAEVWIGLVAPAKTPPQKISELAAWFNAAISAPGVQPRLAAQGLFANTMCGADFGAYLRAQHDQYARVIRDANIKVE